MTEETHSTRHEVELAGLRGVVHQIALMDPIIHVGWDWDMPSCYFCSEGVSWFREEDVVHEPFCLWVMARKLTGVTG